MKIEEMIEEMNKAVDGTLSITHFVEWELQSYKDYSLFFTIIKAESFKSLVEKAYERLEAAQARKEE